MNVRERAEQLRSRLVDAAYQYFVLDAPEMSDEEYDMLLEELRALEAGHPEVMREGSPTEVVGHPHAAGGVKHEPPMGSLGKAHSTEQVEAFVERAHRVGAEMFVAEPKIDGLAVSLTYQNGRLTCAATRGDGVHGENVTDNIHRVVDIPEKLRCADPPPVLVVRGEVYMRRSDLEAYNAELVERGEKTLATTRNAAAGVLRRSGDGSAPPLRFFAYDIARVEDAPEPSSQSEALNILHTVGFKVADIVGATGGLDGLMEYYDKVMTARALLPYDIDGVVYKVDRRAHQLVMGTTATAPRWAVAHKFPPKVTTTTVSAIHHNISRNGVFVPVAQLAPVTIDGVVVGRATLHNTDHVSVLDVRVGDTVFVRRAGDVVPEVTSVDLSRRPVDQNGQPLHPRYEPPSRCPSCGSDVSREPGSAAVRCTASTQCSHQIVQALKHFASRRAMDIKGLGEKVAWELVKNAGVKSPADLYDLRPQDLMLGRSTKAAQKLHAAIATSRHLADLSRLVFALGVPGVGHTAAQALADYFGTLGQMVQATEQQLQSVPALGVATACKVFAFFSDPHNAEVTTRLSEVFDNR